MATLLRRSALPAPQAARLPQPARAVTPRQPGWFRRLLPQQLPPALSVQVQQGTTTLQAYAVLGAVATAGPDLGNLWAIYQAKQATANQLALYWEGIMRAGGFAAATGPAYSAAYQAQVAAGDAYVNWVNAYHQVYPTPHGDAPLPTS